MIQDKSIIDSICDTAVKAAEAANYTNAGTVEFLVDKDMNYYFMEINTRVQVEHTVSEMVTGIDIVRTQIKLAFGKKLLFKQEDVQIRGHAIEMRINAEDPYHDFRPSPGKITIFHAPGGHGVRLDTHVYAGYTIPPNYDSMIAKLIVTAQTREEAISKMRRALDEYRITGVKTNIPFHQRMMDSHRFMSGKFDTEFVENRFSLTDREKPHGMEAAILVALAFHEQSQRAGQIVRAGSSETANWKWYGRLR